MWSAKALEYGGRYLRRAVADADDVEARGAMMLAATMAGVGFGSAGVHIPHACAYPIAGLKHAYQPPGYPDDHPFVPHGHSVIVTAPGGVPLHLRGRRPSATTSVAELLAGEPLADAGPDTLPDVLRALMRDVDAPRGIAELGYDEDDVPALVEGALKQQRLLVVSPREVSRRRPRPHPQRVDDQLVIGGQQTRDAEDVRLYMFECGTLECHVENIKMNQGSGTSLLDPGAVVPAHPSEGQRRHRRRQRRRVATDALGHWGASATSTSPDDAEQACVPALEAGLRPAR